MILGKVYGYIIRLIGLILQSLFFSVLLIVTVNLMPQSLENLRGWAEQYSMYICLLVVVATLVYWRKLMPTVRTFASINHFEATGDPLARLNSRSKVYVLFLISVMMFIFAVFHELPIWEVLNQHPVRYGYVADIFLAVVILIMIADFAAPTEAQINMSAFAPDNPNGEISPTETQQQAIDHLANIFVSGMPRSVALNGDWGSGKTLVYKLARKDAALTNEEIIWVDFNPWQYASEEALVKGFYETIAKEIDEKIPGLQNTLIKITRSVEQLVSKSDNGNIFQMLSGIVKDVSSVNHTPDEIIKGLIRREGKRLVIVLDDIERQYDSERAFRALQLVHHAKTMGESNVQVLCIFERDALLNAVPPHVPSGQEYLEKFSEIEISLPPPTYTSLKMQLDQLIDSEAYGKLLPKDFSLEINNAIVKDIKSHRGVIRAFNELLLEFYNTKRRIQRLTTKERNKSDEIVTYVNYTDRFVMGHIKLKYPLIYRDIAENRGLYTTPKENEKELRIRFMENKELEERNAKHFKELFANQHLAEEQAETVKELLVSIFPKVYKALDSYSRSVDEAELRQNRRIGHRDVLDAYFALTASQDAYNQHREWMSELLERIEKVGDAKLITRFAAYMQKAEADKSDVDSLTLLRNELLSKRHASYQLRLFRAWLRAVLTYQATSASFDKNRIIGRILSAINDVVMRSPQEGRVALGSYVFEGVTRYLRDPYDALLLLLFLLPQRQNYYMSDYINSNAFRKTGGLYSRVLKWVDNYILTKKINVYRDYPTEWQFILFQWSLSISVEGTEVNSQVPGSKERLDRANNYIFKLLNKDDRLAVKIIQKMLGGERDGRRLEEETEGWQVNNRTLAYLNPQRLRKRIEELLTSKTLTVKERDSFRNLLGVLNDYLGNSSEE